LKGIPPQFAFAPLAMYTREIRDLLRVGLHVCDFDIANCQFEIVLKHIVPENALEDYNALTFYIQNRDHCLERITKHYGVSQDAAKQVCLRLLNRGSIDAWREEHGVDPSLHDDAWLEDLSSQCTAFVDDFWATAPDSDKETALSWKKERPECSYYYYMWTMYMIIHIWIIRFKYYTI
jgi:hypothetical protein